jgi:hypothetical protein
MVFTTRQGRHEDIGALLKIMNECFPPNLVSDEEDYRGRLEKVPEHVIVGLVDGKPAGYASSLILTKKPTIREWEYMTSWDKVGSAAEYHDPDGSCFYLGAIAMKIQYRWNGFGTKLFMETARLAKSKGHSTVYFLTSPEKSAYFQRIGARMIDKEFSQFYGSPHAWHSFDTSKV